MIKNKNGFSLVGTLVGLAVSVIILVGVLDLITSVYQTKETVTSQAMIDTFHAASLQIIRNTDKVKTITGINTNPALEDCLGGRGVNCINFQNQGARPFDAAGLNLNARFSNQGICATPTDPKCNITRNVSYSFTCPSATTCSDLRILTTTNFAENNLSPKMPTKNITGRSSTITIPGALLVSRNSIDFSCGSNRLITSVDYKNLRTICSDISGNTVGPNLEPLRSFGPSSPTTVYQVSLTNSSCPSTGFGSIGLYSPQTSCQPLPPPPSATNCVGSWGACSATCGGGIQFYSIITPPKNGGASCPFAQGQTQACNTQICSVNCVGAWTACSQTCGGGTMTYVVTQPALGGGAACPVPNGTVNACNTQSCNPPLALVLPIRVFGNNGRVWGMNTFLPPSNGRINAWLVEWQFSATGGQPPYTFKFNWIKSNGERVIAFDPNTGLVRIQDDKNRNSSFEISVTDGVSTASQIVNFNMWW